MTINNKSERNYRGKCLGWPVTSYGGENFFLPRETTTWTFDSHVIRLCTLKRRQICMPVSLMSTSHWSRITFLTREGIHYVSLSKKRVYNCKNISDCYIASLSLNKMSTMIGWLLVTCPWSNSNVSRPGYNCAVVARTPSFFLNI